MSDLNSIRFNTFMCKRLELKDDLEIKNYVETLRTVSAFALSANKMVKCSGIVNEMLAILHKSAVKNNDAYALGLCEKLAADLLEELEK